MLIGNLTKDIDLKFQAGSGLAIGKFSLAVARQKKGETDFINCIAFGKTAETMSQYLFKGSKVAVEGHIQTGSYTNKEGHKVYTTDVVIDLSLIHISRRLKLLAMELNIPIVIMAQINRTVDKQVDKRPTCADLKESGSIEEDLSLIHI